jgi:hypothetical protein
MNKHRINIVNKQGSKLIHKNDLDSCLENLSIAHFYLSKHLKGKNDMGLLTNILNSSYEIKKHFNK